MKTIEQIKVYIGNLKQQLTDLEINKLENSVSMKKKGHLEYKHKKIQIVSILKTLYWVLSEKDKQNKSVATLCKT